MTGFNRENDLPTLPEPYDATNALERAADIARCEVIFQGADAADLTALLETPTRSAFLTAAKGLLAPECPVHTEARLLLRDQFNLATVREVMDAVPGLRVQRDDVAYADMLGGYVDRQIRKANLKDSARFLQIWPGLVEHVIGVSTEAAIAHGGALRINRILPRLARAGLHHGVTVDNPGMATIALTHAVLSRTTDAIPGVSTASALTYLGYYGTSDAFTRACISLASSAYLDDDTPPSPAAVTFAEDVLHFTAATAEALATFGDPGRARIALRVALQTEQSLRAAVPERIPGVVDALRSRLADLGTPGVDR
jgi:hypothetical protein